jgi:oligopeptide/dipeptide ABC transporter ATP-binding protein
MSGEARASLLEVDHLVRHFPLRRGLLAGLAGEGRAIRAVNGVSFTLRPGESLGLAGESGCGKTTIVRLLLKLDTPTRGRIRFDGQDLAALRGAALKRFRRRAQLMFQNPYESFSPRFTIFRAVVEPLLVHGIGDADERAERVRRALSDVQLRPAEMFFDRYPHQLSGGQLQRAMLARALVLEPEFLAADEPVSMLDVSVRAGILNTMKEQARRRNLTTLYISHDLSLIQYLCDTTAIMYLGAIVEMGPAAEVIGNPQHPYTQALVTAIPVPRPRRRETWIPITGGVPSAIDVPGGCPFHPRCPYAMDICTRRMPPPFPVGNRHVARCWLRGEEGAEAKALAE